MNTRTNQFASIEKRTFESALVHMLETEYGILGGRRILQLLAEDVKALVDASYLATERLQFGQIVWTCTADEGKKAIPGKRTEDYKSVNVVLPLLTREDLQDWTTSNLSHMHIKAHVDAREQRRAVRLVKAAYAQGGLLTLAELSALLNHNYKHLGELLRRYEQETSEHLPLKGDRMDQGSRPTHKAEIVRLFEQGLQPPDIARETSHALKSVERYLKDYDRVRLLLQQGLSVAEISAMIDRGQRVVIEYVKIIELYHPNIWPRTNSAGGGS